MPVEIKLTQGYVTTICDCHAHLVSGHKWHVRFEYKSRRPYAQRKSSVLTGRKAIYLHAVINNTPKGFHTDHINGDTLDNRCMNLRTATYDQNMRNQGKQRRNTSGYKGVSWDKHDHAWKATIRVNGKNKTVGYWHSAEDAARAYDAAAIEYHGEFAKLNFPKENKQ